MSYANHPLLCTSVPPANSFSEVETGAWTCTSSTGNSAFTFNPKTLAPGIAVGDLMILRIHLENISPSVASIRPRGPGYPEWSIMYGATARADGSWWGGRGFSSAPQMQIWYKFYEASDDTTHDFYKGATGNACYSLLVLRNVSRSTPFDCPGAVGAFGSTNWRNWSDFPYQIPGLPIGTSTFNFFMDGCHYIAGTGTPVEVSDNDLLLPSGVNLLTSQWDGELNGGAYSRKLVLLKGSAPTGAHQNLLKSVTQSTSSGAQLSGFSYTNMRLGSVSPPLSGTNIYDVEVAGDNTSQTHFMEAEFEATTGQGYIVEVSLATVSNSGNTAPVIAIVNPDNSLECGCFYSIFAISGNLQYTTIRSAKASDADFANDPTYMGYHQPYSGSSFTDPHPALVTFRFVATQTGTHKLRIYLCDDGSSADTPPYSFLKTWNPGAASWYVTNCYFWSAAVSNDSQMPSRLVSPGASGQTAGQADSRIAPVTPPIAFMGSYSQTTIENQPRAVVFSNLVLSGQAPSPVRLAFDDYYSVSTVLNLDATDEMSIPAIAGMSGPVNALVCVAIHPTRAVGAKYYETDSTATPSAGKYYAEIEIGVTNNTDRILVAVMPVAGASGYCTTNRPDQIDSNCYGGANYSSSGGINYNGFNSRGTTFQTFAAGDIIGVAIDYETSGGVISFYHNGTLQSSVSIYGGSYDIGFTPNPDLMVCLFTGTTSGYLFPTCTFNLTGPFAYTKPSGFVAYDHRNEVA